MIAKNKISEVCQLHQKKVRDQLSLFIVEGTKSVCELLNSSMKIKELYASEKWIEEHKNLISDKINIFIASYSEMERMSNLKTPQEVLAVVFAPHFSVCDIDDKLPLLVLDDIRDPGNMGTIIRTAEWFGFQQILCSETTVEFANPKTIQATMGSFCRIKIVYTNLPSFFKSRQNNNNVFGTFMEGTNIAESLFPSDAIIVIGNESTGISEENKPFINKRIHIPSPIVKGQKAESLNASVAAAIVMYQYSISLLK